MATVAATATTVIGWAAVPAVNAVLSKTRSFLEDRSQLKGEGLLLVARMDSKLTFMHNHLHSLEGCPDKDIRDWLEKVKGQLIGIENLVDTIKVKSGQKKKNNKKKAQRKKKHNKSNVGEDDFSYALESADIEELKHADVKLDLYCDELRIRTNSSWMQNLKPDNAGSVAPTGKIVIGREAEERKLLDMLLSKTTCHTNPRVICMVGESGIGKSSLARLIFQNPIIRIFFDLRGWIVKPTQERLIGNLISAFRNEGCDFDFEPEKEVQIHAQISGVMKTKRFLIVFDDAPDNVDDIWTMLSPTFAVAGPESAMLVLTKSEDVAARLGERTGQYDCLMLPPLPQSTMCRILLHHSAVGPESNELKQMAGKICSRLHGLPLLAEVMGHLLSKDHSKDYWRKVTEHVWWKQHDSHENIGLAAMAVVAAHISFSLQHCLGYSSMFPDGHLFYRTKLISMWSDTFCYDDSIRLHTDEIFDSLESMGLLQRSKNEIYTMNEVVRAAASYIDVNGLYGTSYKDSVKKCSNEKSHVAVDASDAYLYYGSRTACRWRTLLFLDCRRTSKVDERLGNMLSHANGLRALDLSNVRLTSKSPPENVQYLMLLGFLDLSFTGIRTFPRFLCELINLKFLGLKGCYFKELPKQITKLINLQHFSAEKATYTMIAQVGKLTDLLDLQLFRVKREEGYHITELGNLSKLRGTIQIENLELVSSASEAEAAEFFKKENLRRLELKWDVKAVCMHSKEVLKRLEQPLNLEELQICGYCAPSFPAWVGQGPSSLNLRHIEIIHCIELERLPPLGLLPSLEVLLLQNLPGITEITGEFYGINPKAFQSLEEMVICDMPSLVTWKALLPNQLMPKLRKVQILKCKILEEAPLCSFKAPLIDLVLSDCPLLLESSGSCLSGLVTVKHLTVRNASYLKTLPWNSLSAVELLRIDRCDSLSFDGSELPRNIKRFIKDHSTIIEHIDMSSYKNIDMLHCSTSSAPSGSANGIAEDPSNGSALQLSLYGKVTDPLSPGGLEDSHRSTRSVYKRSHALITQESYALRPVPEWSNTLGAYLIIPKIGADFAMYFAKMEGGSKSAQPKEGVARFVFVIKGSASLSLDSGIHSLSVDDYVYIPANMKHLLVSNESATLIVVEKRYSAAEEYHPDLVVSSVDKQLLLETPGEVFQLRKLLPTSMAYDFNIHIMEFQPGECHKIQEVHYNEHGLFFLEGRGIYKFGNEVQMVQGGDAIWTAPFVPHWYAALGKSKTRYLLYENVNRDPLLI